MNWAQLIAIARLLATAPDYGERRGRPQQIQLRKAVSATYYALFHALAKSNADTLIGVSPPFRGLPAWTQTYRALDHGPAKNRIQSGLNEFAPAVRSFGSAFIFLQEERHRADYDPDAEFTRSDAVFLIDRAEVSIRGFEATEPTQRKAFAAHVLFRPR